MKVLVSTDWLGRHLANPDLVVLESSVRTESVNGGVRNVSGLEDYRRGHVASAGFIDLKGGL